MLSTTSIWNFAGGPAAPAFELIQIFADRMGIDTGVDREAVVRINKELRIIREELADFDTFRQVPLDFDFSKDKLPREINRQFTKAI